MSANGRLPVLIVILVPTLGFVLIGLALLVLTPISFEVLAGAILALMILWELRSWRRGYYRPASRGRQGDATAATERNLYGIAEITTFAVVAGLMYFVLDFSAVSALLMIAIGFVSTVSFRLTLLRLVGSQAELDT